MMTFVEVDELAATYERLIASDWRVVQRKAHDKFAVRFAPRALFLRAGVYRDWELGPQRTASEDEVGSAVNLRGMGEGYAPCGAV